MIKGMGATYLCRCKGESRYDEVIFTMPGISTLDNILLIKYLKTGGKKIDLNARGFTRGF